MKETDNEIKITDEKKSEEKNSSPHKKIKAEVKKAGAEVKNDVKRVRSEVRADVKRAADSVAAKRSRRERQVVTFNPLKLLIITVPRNKAEYYADFIQSFEVNMQMTVLGEGTASTGMLAALGMTESSKSVIFGVIQGDKVEDAMYALEEKFNTIKGGKGIAFTVPLTSVIGALTFRFLADDKR